MIESYPKVHNLGTPDVVDLLKGDVLVQEKVDGSQISFGWVDNELHIRSKSALVARYTYGVGKPELLEVGPSYKPFLGAVENILRWAPIQAPHTVYRGEYLSKPKHNTIAYDRVPRNNIIIFDVQDVGLSEPRFYSQAELEKEARRIGFEPVKMIWSGAGDNLLPETFKKWMNTPAALGGSNVEGVVIKNYAQRDRQGKTLMGKHVSEACKETHRGDWKERNPNGGDIIFKIGSGLSQPGRYVKAVQHLEERGELCGEPKDIGPLMKEAAQDILAEEKEAIQEALFKWAWPKIQKLAISGLPQWYKDQLAAKQFERSNDV